MVSLNIDQHFQAIWRRALNEPSLGSLTPHLIESFAAARDLNGASVEDRDVGIFAVTKSIVLTVGTSGRVFQRFP
jgi:hypothetical protein